MGRRKALKVEEHMLPENRSGAEDKGLAVLHYALTINQYMILHISINSLSGLPFMTPANSRCSQINPILIYFLAWERLYNRPLP